MIEKISTTSENIQNENLEKLQKVFPQFVKDKEIDFDALRAFFDAENIIAGTEKYGLNWAGKSNAFKAIRTSATGTLAPQIEESKNWDTTENVFIEGDNLEVLKLLQKHYREKIKMIYIDPPYNTGKDFVYKDNFTQSVADYYEQTGQAEGGIKMTANTEKNGRYHSDWLTMMYPRLFLAKNLLLDDGVIFVSIDDNEVANLRLIMDEIFGEENFISEFIWHSSTGGGIRSRFVNQSHQYIVCYAKNIIETKMFYASLSEEAKKQYKKEDDRGVYREKDFAWKNSSWGTNQKYFIECPNGEKVKPKDGYLFRFIRSTFDEYFAKDMVVFKATKNGPLVKENGEQANWNIYIKKYLGDGTGAPSSVIPRDLVGINNEGTTELNDLFGGNFFESPKNVRLLKYLFSLVEEDDGDIVLDFFAGSGTTAHAVMDLNAEDSGNRKFICVQLPEMTEEESEAYKAGYKNIAEISRERIRRAGEKIGKEDIGFKSFSLQKSNYRQWNVLTENDNKEKILAQSKLFLGHPLTDGFDEKSVVYEILLKEGFSLNAKVNQQAKAFPISDDKSNFAGDYVWIAREGDKTLVASFREKVTKEDVDALKLKSEDIFVCLDSALDDTAKVNILRNLTLKVI